MAAGGGGVRRGGGGRGRPRARGGGGRARAGNVFGLGLAAQRADVIWGLAVPGTYVIDPAGTIRAAHTDADYRTRMDPADIVAALIEIGASA
mgnify:CR=1 FL=1